MDIKEHVESANAYNILIGDRRENEHMCLHIETGIIILDAKKI